MTDTVTGAEIEAPGNATLLPANPPPEQRGDGNSSQRQSQGRRRRSKSSRQLAKVQRTNRNLKIGLAVLIMALTTVIVVGKQAQSKLNEHRATLDQRIDTLRSKLSAAETLSKKLLTDMNELVESRLPGLRPLEFDAIIQLSDQYVKNVIFAVSKEAQQTNYEYRFVFFNPKITPVFPQVKLLLFDNRGLQVGGADVTLTGEASEGRVRSLGPGEIRSYNGSASIISTGKPSYFMLDIGSK